MQNVLETKESQHGWSKRMQHGGGGVLWPGWALAAGTRQAWKPRQALASMTRTHAASLSHSYCQHTGELDPIENYIN